MTKAGDVIENPVTGERVIFLKTAAETGGELLQAVITVRPGGFVAAEHVHPHQDEHFRVAAGRLTARVAGVESTHGVGAEFTVAAGTPHIWWNSGDTELRVEVDFRPAGRFDSFMTSFFALAQQGKTDAKGMPNLVQLAVLARAYQEDIYPTSPPRALQKILFAVLDPIGRALGYVADVPYEKRR